jgi:type 1 glutamine amidotransferase
MMGDSPRYQQANDVETAGMSQVFLPKITQCVAFSLCLSSCALPVTQEHQQQTGPKRWQSYEGKQGQGKGKLVVLISGDEEYHSDEALSELGQILAKHHGFSATVLYAQDPNQPGVVNPNYQKNIPGLEALRNADLMVIATRFRELPDEQMQELESYLHSGRPVIGLRTATHAFKFPKNSKWGHWSYDYDGTNSTWKNGFGEVLFGTTWIAHHGWHKHEGTRGIAAGKHDIINGISRGDIWGSSDVYAAPRMLPDDSHVVVYGQVLSGMNKNDKAIGPAPYEKTPSYGKNDANFHKNDPMMPVAWTKSYRLPDGKKGKVFVTTMGASADLVAEGTRRMIVNAVYWCLDMATPVKGARVDIVQGFDPSAYGFKSNEYWLKKNRRITDYDIK